MDFARISVAVDRVADFGGEFDGRDGGGRSDGAIEGLSVASGNQFVVQVMSLARDRNVSDVSVEGYGNEKSIGLLQVGVVSDSTMDIYRAELTFCK